MIGYLKKYSCFSVSILLILSIFGCSSIYSSPQIKEINEQKKLRMENLKSLGIETQVYTYNCPDEELDRRFDKISSNRWKAYFINPEDYGKKDAMGIYKDEYKTPNNWKLWNSRYPYPLAFDYNLAYEKYNASIVLLNNTKFLAIEAPSSKNINEFYNLFNKYDVSNFVKLNSPDEYNEDYYQFWNENKEDDTHIKLGHNSVNFFSYEWPHRQQADIPTLIKLIKSDQEAFDYSEFMAVSCRAAAGRTGTFIASYVIIDKIDKQLNSGIKLDDIKLNIDDIVWEISVQRPFAITHKNQYKMLYRLADYYIQSKR